MEIKRLLEPKFFYVLQNIGAVLIVGPKFCGKTYLGEKYTKSKISFGNLYYLKESEVSESLVIDGPKPRLIDEWQDFPVSWDMVRVAIDKGDAEGRHQGLFVLTGSSTPFNWSTIKHNGLGRILVFRLGTLTFCEILNLPEDKSISFKSLINQQKIKYMDNGLRIEESCNLLIIGGWPEYWAKKNIDNNVLIKAIIQSITKSKIDKLINFYVSQTTLFNILHSFARLSTSPINISTVVEDQKNKVSRDTIEKYYQTLLYQEVIFELPIWNTHNFRSPYALRTKPKTYFCDTSIICHLLKIKNINDFSNDLKTAGIIFENQAIKDLKVFAELNDAQLYFYRDEKGNELDAIMELENGDWIAIEIKLSTKAAFDAVKKMDNTIKLMNVDSSKPLPLFKLIITNDTEAHQLIDGTYIIPLSLLRA